MRQERDIVVERHIHGVALIPEPFFPPAGKVTGTLDGVSRRRCLNLRTARAPQEHHPSHLSARDARGRRGASLFMTLFGPNSLQQPSQGLLGVISVGARSSTFPTKRASESERKGGLSRRGAPRGVGRLGKWWLARRRRLCGGDGRGGRGG